jgi:hypothetical protein
VLRNSKTQGNGKVLIKPLKWLYFSLSPLIASALMPRFIVILIIFIKFIFYSAPYLGF